MTENDDSASREMLAQLIARLDFLEQALRQNTQRLHSIEQYLDARTAWERSGAHVTDDASAIPDAASGEDSATHASASTSATAQESATHAVTSTQADAKFSEPHPDATTTTGAVHFTYRRADAKPGGESHAHDAGTHDAPQADSRTPTDGTAAARRRDLETVVGGSWFNWIGIIAITFGVAFFLKLAFDNEWIGPTARVILGGVAGVAILFTGERLNRRGLRQYASVISGGGVLILYLSIYAAYDFYHLIAQAPAFLLMALVTTAAVLLSVRLDALAVAVLGLLGGFLTPILLATGQDNQVGLFTYIALLDAGVLALAYFKQWRSLNHLSFIATAFTFGAWMTEYYVREKLWLTLFFFALFFALFSALAVVHNILRQRLARWFDISLIIANATFFFGLAYALLETASYRRVVPASLALVVSAFFVALFYLTWREHRADGLLKYAYVGAAVTFFTVALAIQLEQHWVTMAWAVEALMLTWVGLRSGESAPRHAALFVFSCAVIHWFGWDVADFGLGSATGFVPLLNRRAFSCAVLVASLAACAWLYRRREAAGVVTEEDRSTLGALHILAANAMALTLLTLDINDYFEQRKLAAGAPAPTDYLAGRLENSQQFSISALWIFYGGAALSLGVRRNLKLLRYGALALLVLATIKVVARDLSFYAAPWHTPLLNQTFAALALLVAAYAYAVRLFRQRDAHLGEEERTLVPILVIVAHTLLIVAFSAEAGGYFQSQIASGLREEAGLRDLELARQLSLSVIWAAYGGALFLYGRLRRDRLLRLMALILLGLTTLKVFFLDLSSLDRVYRIIAFIVLGVILLAVSYLYQRSQQQQSATNGAEGK